MKVLGGLLSLMLLMVAVSLHAQTARDLFATKERTAVVTDVSGKVVELRNPEFPGMCGDFGWEWGSCVVVGLDPFRLGIPSNVIESIKCPDLPKKSRFGSTIKTCEITHSSFGERRTVAAVMSNGIKGTTPSGAEFVDIEHLRSVTFRGSAAAAVAQEARPAFDATLVLKDGRNVPVGNLIAEYGDFVRATIGIGGTTRRRPEGEIYVTKGGNHFTLRFGELRAIEFLPAGQINITSIDGSTALADLSRVNREELRNLSGVSSDGQFIVFAGDLKAIRFGPQVKTSESSPADASAKEVRPGVSAILLGVERVAEYNLGRGQIMKPKDPAYEYAVVKLTLSWPVSEKVFELASSELQLLDGEGKSLDAQPLSVFQLMIEGPSEKHPVDLSFLIRKGIGLKSFRIGNAVFDLRDGPVKP
jgi:hypothetical protein